MASKIAGSVKTLGLFVKPTIFDKGVGALLPEAYKKFYIEWKMTEPTAVHYIPEEGNWKRDELTGEVSPIQNTPIKLMFPRESHQHIWGGEGVIQGFVRPSNKRRRTPRFWFPHLQRTVVYSEVLDKYISVVVTDRAINLITAHYGFDHYLLKTPACDLQSLLALGLKRKILLELEKGCPTYKDKPDIQKNILDTYHKYLEAYTPEEIKWYGYSFTEACRIIKAEIDDANQKPIPLKNVYRAQLIESMKAAGQAEENGESSAQLGNTGLSTPSWLQKINPFGKKHET